MSAHSAPFAGLPRAPRATRHGRARFSWPGSALTENRLSILKQRPSARTSPAARLAGRSAGGHQRALPGQSLAALGLLSARAPTVRYHGQATAEHGLMARGGEAWAGTDGSGGPHATDLRLRRVGWGWAVVNPDGTLLGGASGGLDPDEEATVPRAELHGLLHFLRTVRVASGQLEVAVDNLYVLQAAQGFADGSRGLPGPDTRNGDLLAQLAPLVKARRTELLFVKVKAHLELPAAVAGGCPATRWWANHHADRMAGEGAERHQFGLGDRRALERIDQTAALVVMRHIAVTRLVVAGSDGGAAPPRSAPPGRPAFC